MAQTYSQCSQYHWSNINLLFRHIPERYAPSLPRHLLALLLVLIKDLTSVPAPPDMLPSPCLAELRGLQHSVICCDTETSGGGLALGSTGHSHPTGGSRAKQCQQQEGAGSRADSGRAQLSSCCLRTGSCGYLLPKGVGPCCCPLLSLSTVLLTTSNHPAFPGLQYGQSKQFGCQQPPT